ncbi:hypothetical protein [Nonomuraea sp. NPDC046570]|uniref:hypothetical protein n=1 Tax=Nonomuraea sp. NPDC046570 TaxID=3155255 RepID=UPI0033CD76DB
MAGAVGCSAGGVESSMVTVILGAAYGEARGGSDDPSPVKKPMRNPSTPVSPEASRRIVGLLVARG